MIPPTMSDEFATAFRARLLTHVAASAPDRSRAATSAASTLEQTGIRDPERSAPRRPEHDDVRDLLLAGTQRIRLVRTRRAIVPAVLALILVAGVVGAVAATIVNTGAQVAATPTSDPPSPTTQATTEPLKPTPLPAASLPDIGGQATLEPDPTKVWDRLFHALDWPMEQGLDIKTLQGFQRVGGIQAWTAEMEDGSGTCILLRTSDGSLFDSMGCESDGVPASVDRALTDSVLLRFTINGGLIDVYVTSP